MQKYLRARVSLTNPQHFLALGFGSGLIPIMPGTFGTLAGLPIVWALSLMPEHYYFVAIILSVIIGIKVCETTSVDMRVHDHGSIVWDEVAGIIITFAFVPVNWFTLVVGFVLFRIFDILKPWPIRTFDKKVHGGFGIMLDDVVAGVIACIILNASLPLINQLF